MIREKTKVYIKGNPKVKTKAQRSVTATVSRYIRETVEQYTSQERMYARIQKLHEDLYHDYTIIIEEVEKDFKYSVYELDQSELYDFVFEIYNDSFVRSVVKNINKWGIERGGQPYTKMTNQSAAALLGLKMEFAEPIDYSTRATDKQISFAAGLAKKAGFKLTKDILTKEEAGAVIGFFHHKSDSEEGKAIVRSITEKL